MYPSLVTITCLTTLKAVKMRKPYKSKRSDPTSPKGSGSTTLLWRRRHTDKMLIHDDVTEDLHLLLELVPLLLRPLPQWQLPVQHGSRLAQLHLQNFYILARRTQIYVVSKLSIFLIWFNALKEKICWSYGQCGHPKSKNEIKLI